MVDLSLFVSEDTIVVSENSEYLKDDLIVQRSKPYGVRSGRHSLPAEALFNGHVKGIAGFIELLRGPYLLLITKITPVSEIEYPVGTRHQIYLVNDVELLPVDGSKQSLSVEEKADEEQYKGMLVHLLSSETFYFSYTYDISSSLQRNLKKTKTAQTDEPSWKNGDLRFVWNSSAQEKILAANFSRPWLVGLVQGFFKIEEGCQFKPNDKDGLVKAGNNAQGSFTFGILSRRDKNRVGTRYHSRGSDEKGNVSNYVESEQFIQAKTLNGRTITNSFVQIRGSIPLVWTQDVDLHYNPDIVINSANKESARLHFKQQIELYKRQVVVDLVKGKGDEAELNAKYEESVKDAEEFLKNGKEGESPLRYVGFDVYKYCGKSNYGQLQILLDRVDSEFETLKYTSVKEGEEQPTFQEGVFRTNCKDCLDRTNMIQTILAKVSLLRQLKDLGIADFERPSQAVQMAADKTSFFATFRNMWGDNGDAISIQYAGTPALKRDITRIGKRTIQGNIDDGISSLTRYVYNNVVDGYKQDSMQLLNGTFKPQRGDPSPFSVQNNDYGLPKNAIGGLLIFFMGLILSVFGILGPKSLRHRGYLVALTFWLILVVILVRILRISGAAVVSTPRLVKSLTNIKK